MSSENPTSTVETPSKPRAYTNNELISRFLGSWAVTIGIEMAFSAERMLHGRDLRWAIFVLSCFVIIGFGISLLLISIARAVASNPSQAEKAAWSAIGNTLLALCIPLAFAFCLIMYL